MKYSLKSARVGICRTDLHVLEGELIPKVPGIRGASVLLVGEGRL